jgi:hypothetical protein
MSANTERGFIGYGKLKKTGGSGPFTNAAEASIPAMQWIPRSPLNNSYPPMVNKSAYPGLVVLGVRTPSVGIRTCMKSSWCTAALLNSLVFTSDTYGDNDAFGIIVNAGETTRVYDNARCAAISLAGAAAGGPVAMEFGFLASTDVGATTFAGYTADAGQLINRAQIDFGSSATANLVRSFRISWVRGVGYDMYYNQTYYPSDTSSGMFGGTLALEMSSKATVIPSTAGTIRFFTGVPGSLSLYMTMAFLLNLDEEVHDVDVGPGVLVRSYSLIDLSAAGNPSTVS